MNPSVIIDNLGYLLVGAWPDGPVGGLALTLILSGLSGLASAALGFLRAVPVVMLIFWTYFLLPILFGVSIPEIGTVAVALSLVGGAYLSHGVAAGIASVGRGQWEAGLALGLDPWRTLRFVVLPQALRAMAPSFVNQWTTLIQDTALAYVIGVPELAFVAAQVNNRAMVYPAEIFLFVGAVYGILCAGLDGLAARLTNTGKVAAHRTP